MKYRWYEAVGWSVFLLIVLGVMTFGSVADSAKVVPVHSGWVYLKSGGEFTHWAKISNEHDFDRMVNKKNIATVRKIGKDTILVDGNINVKFESSEERERFLSELAK